MVRKFYNLPPLTGMAVFEAAVRHMSFRLAAAEHEDRRKRHAVLQHEEERGDGDGRRERPRHDQARGRERAPRQRAPKMQSKPAQRRELGGVAQERSDHRPDAALTVIPHAGEGRQLHLIDISGVTAG